MFFIYLSSLPNYIPRGFVDKPESFWCSSLNVGFTGWPVSPRRVSRYVVKDLYKQGVI
jgi:hypothetical protein